MSKTVYHWRQEEFLNQCSITNELSKVVGEGVRQEQNDNDLICQAHLNCYQNLRIRNSKIPNAGLGLFYGNRQIKKNLPIIEYTGPVGNRPVRGNYVLEVNKTKFIM